MKKHYESMEPGYYHKAYTSGNAMQRYWHKGRFEKILSKINSNRKSILDLGCGPGTLLSMIPKNYSNAVGMDFDEKQIAFAKEKFKHLKKIRWIAGDINKIKLNEKFDYIICSEVLEHIKSNEADKLLSRMKQLLKEGGKIILTTPNYRSFWPMTEFFVNLFGKVNYAEQHTNRFNIKKMKSILKKNDLNIRTIETFFIFAPVLSFISAKLAKAVQKIDDKILPNFGSVILVVAEK